MLLAPFRLTSVGPPTIHTFVGQIRHLASNGRSFMESDIVLLHPIGERYPTPILTRPLSPGTKIQTHRGNIEHEDIIGKCVRDIVQSNNGSGFRIQDVSLGEYARMSKRLVTPIYPADANLIVSLFDIHVSPPADSHRKNDDAPLEILEAGTGHGALTLHLSRAIHGANPPVRANEHAPAPSTLGEAAQAGTDSEEEQPASTTAEDTTEYWKKQRRAILHTIDVSSRYSKHAEKVVKGFRHGMYAGNVDFHVGDVSAWVREQMVLRHETASHEPAEPFLTHAFLDLPSTHTHLATVASAMHVDGVLVVFNPSITQVAECVQQVKQENLPLHLDQVLELGTNGSSGGRQWDVRAVIPRVETSRANDEVTEQSRRDAEATSEVSVSGNEADIAVKEDLQKSDVPVESKPDWKLICRPKVGEMIVGGGFLGVFRKIRERQ